MILFLQVFVSSFRCVGFNRKLAGCKEGCCCHTFSCYLSDFDLDQLFELILLDISNV